MKTNRIKINRVEKINGIKCALSSNQDNNKKQETEHSFQQILEEKIKKLKK